MASNQPEDQAEENQVKLVPAMQAATRERRQLFGQLLKQRREDDLGYTERKGGRRAFEDATGWDTRNSFDIENAKRNNFKEPTLRKAARVYQYTRVSVRDFLLGKSDELVPARAAAPSPDGPGDMIGLGLPPIDDPDARAAAWPYVQDMWKRLGEVPGRYVFPDDRRTADRWDDEGLHRAFNLNDRMWIIAMVQAAEAGQGRNAGIAG